MVRFLFLIYIFVNLKFTHSIPQPEDIFSSEPNEPDFDSGLFPSEELNPLEPNLNDLAGDLDEVIFSPSDEATPVDPPILHADAYASSDNLFADGSVDLNQLQSLCETESGSLNDALRARDYSSCPSTEEKANIELPDLFQDPEAWWRKFPPQQKPSSERQDAGPLGSILRMFQGVGGAAGCPPEYPIRCCTDLISGYIPSPNAPTLYFIKPLDCIASMFPFPLSASETRYVSESGPAKGYKRRCTKLTVYL